MVPQFRCGFQGSEDLCDAVDELLSSASSLLTADHAEERFLSSAQFSVNLTADNFFLLLLLLPRKRVAQNTVLTNEL